jgi:UDP-N-acetylmuramate--alanine ligase
VILGSGRHAGTLERAARVGVWRLERDFAARVLECGARGTRLRLEGPGGDTAVARLRLRTTHPADNAALAYAALRALGWSADEAAGALGRLTGLARRLEQVGTADSVTVVDDFGKHPGCIARTLAVLRARTAGKIIVVYEAHRHEHVSRWGRRLAAALGAADAVAVLPVNDRVLRARRRVPPDWFRAAGLGAEPVADPARATEWVTRQARPGDVVCVLGVHDDLGQLAHRILAALRARGRDG